MFAQAVNGVLDNVVTFILIFGAVAIVLLIIGAVAGVTIGFWGAIKTAEEDRSRETRMTPPPLPPRDRENL